MLRLLQPLYRFSQKYFHDEKYTNLTLYSQNKMGSLSHIADYFTQLNIDMVFVKSQFCNAWTAKKKYVLNISILKQPETKIQELRNLLTKSGVEMEENAPIQVPWFPKTKEDLNLIGQVLLDVKD